MNGKQGVLTHVIMTVASRTTKGKTYEIRQSLTSGLVYCTCPAWAFSKGTRKNCKHLIEHGFGTEGAARV